MWLHLQNVLSRPDHNLLKLIYLLTKLVFLALALIDLLSRRFLKLTEFFLYRHQSFIKVLRSMLLSQGLNLFHNTFIALKWGLRLFRAFWSYITHFILPHFTWILPLYLIAAFPLWTAQHRPLSDFFSWSFRNPSQQLGNVRIVVFFPKVSLLIFLRVLFELW